MNLSAIGSSSQNDSIYKGGSKTLGKDDFLKLLVTQLQNQDPLNPTDSTEFVAQLAQFSSLEQLSNVNENLRIIQLFDQSINNAQAVGFIGKTVKASGSMFALEAEKPYGFQYQLAEDADTVYLNFYNSTGEHVREAKLEKVKAGAHEFVWDGLDKNGKSSEPGDYSFTVQAKNQKGELIKAAAFIEEHITGVSYHNNNTFLLAKNLEIPFAAIIGVVESKPK